MKKKWILPWVAFGLWAVVLTILSSVPGGKLPSLKFFEADKVEHFFFFLFGSVLLSLGFLARGKSPRLKTALAALALMAAVGCLDEIHQLFTPGRSGADPFDLLADVLGASVGIICTFLIHGRYRAEDQNLGTPGANRAA